MENTPQDASGISPDPYSESGLNIYTDKSPSLCLKKRGFWLRAFHERLSVSIFYLPACGCWGCAACGQNMAWQWEKRLKAGIQIYQEQKKKLYFLTLTSHEKLDAKQSAWVLPRAWDKLRKKAQRAGLVGYFAVPELHRSGKIHIHLVIVSEKKMTKKWWKDAARASGLGHQVSLVETVNESTARYITKYLLKSVQENWWAKKTHRVRTSNWYKEEETKPMDWVFTFVKHSVQDAMKEEVSSKQRIVDYTEVSHFLRHPELV